MIYLLFHSIFDFKKAIRIITKLKLRETFADAFREGAWMIHNRSRAGTSTVMRLEAGKL